MSWRSVVRPITWASVLASGFLQFGEVLIEWFSICILMFNPKVSLPTRVNDSWHSDWRIVNFCYSFANNKADKLKTALFGPTPQFAIAQIILAGVAFGWALTALWLLVRDWRFVVSREIIETGLDILVFVPAFLIFRDHFKSRYEQMKQAYLSQQKEVSDQRAIEDAAMNEPDPDPRYDPSNVIGSFAGPWPAHDPKQKIAMQYFLYPMKYRAFFGIHSVDDVREQQDEDSEEQHETTVRQSVRMGSYYFILFGALPFALGLIVSVFYSFDVTSALVNEIF